MRMPSPCAPGPTRASTQSARAVIHCATICGLAAKPPSAITTALAAILLLRPSWVAVLVPRFEHRSLETELGRATGRNQSGEASADRDDIVRHRVSFHAKRPR